jgi:hypothetical protein
MRSAGEVEAIKADREEEVVDLRPADHRQHAVGRAEPLPGLLQRRPIGIQSSAFG